MLFRSSYRYGAAAFLFYGSPRGSHFAKRCDVVPWGFTQIACHSRGNPSHHRASARMPSPFFPKIIVPCFFVPPVGTAPRPLFFLARAPSPLSKNIALRCHEESQKKRVICDGIRRSSVLWLGCLCVYLNKKKFWRWFLRCRHGAATLFPVLRR